MRKITGVLGFIAILGILLASVLPLSTAVVAAAEVWSVPMTATTATEGNNTDLKFGVDTVATDGFDMLIDMPHPPPAPYAKFDAYFNISDPTFSQLNWDYRGPSYPIQWTLYLKSDAEDINLTWDVSAVPGDVLLQIDGIDMKVQNSMTLAAGTRTLYIIAGVGVPIELELKTGWNMVSVPVILADNSVGSVFPSPPVAGIYAWDASTQAYYAPTKVEPEEGYWVAVTSDTSITVTGTPVTQWTSDMFAGWNMIGSVYGTNVDFSNPDDNPDNSVVGYVYWWNPFTKSYEYTTTIEPGKGYWAAAIRACTLTLS